MGDCLGDCFQLCELQPSLSLSRSVVNAAASLLPLFTLSFVGEMEVKQSLVSVLSQSLHSIRLSAVVVAAYIFYLSAGDLHQLGRVCVRLICRIRYVLRVSMLQSTRHLSSAMNAVTHATMSFS